MRSLIANAAAAFLWLGAAGCTFQVPIEPLESVNRPAGIAEVPAMIGVYYSPEFLSYEHKQTVYGGHKLRFEIGQSSADHFDQVFLALFRNIRIVGQRPPLSDSSPNVDAVIEPRIESVAIRDPSLFGWTGWWDVRLTYLFTLFATQGEPLASWTIEGVGQNTRSVDWTGVAGENIAAEAVNRALQDAGEKFLTGFAQVPEVRRWLKEHGYPVSARPTKDFSIHAFWGEGS